MTDRWRKRYWIKIGRDESGFWVNRGWYVYRSVPLSKGKVLRLEFTVFHDLGQSILEPHLLVHEKGRMKWPEKGGFATGPGGMEVWSVLAKIFEDGVNVARKRLAKHDTVYVEVTAATPKLFRIYARFLEPHGYINTGSMLYKRVR